MRAELPEIRSVDGDLVDRAQPMQVVNNAGEDALDALAKAVTSGAPADNMIGYQQLTSQMVASPTALDVPKGAVAATVQNNGTIPCRWLATGDDPNGMLGMRLYGNGDTQTFVGDLSLVRLIREGDNVTLDIAYYG